MKILILGLNYKPEKVGIAVYTSGLAEKLAKMGHEVHVVSGQPYYPAWEIMKPHKSWSYTKSTEEGVHLTRVPHYIPKKPTTFRRVLHHISFAITSFIPVMLKAIRSKPDIVFTIAPSLIAAPNAALAARLCGGKSWLHIQDFEVEAAFATGLMQDENMISKVAKWFERFILKRFNIVSSISPQMCNKLRLKGISSSKVIEFRNWANISKIHPLNRPSEYRKEWGINTPNVVLYSGNIANKQGIEIVMDAAHLLKHRKDITFVICGEGPNRAKLEKLAVGLTNIQFHPLQPFERLNDLVGLATVHLLPQKADAADLVLPSKLTNMLASGRPVVATAAAGTGLANEVEGCGIVTEPGDSNAFANAIEALIDEPSRYKLLCLEARKRAEARWSGEAILSGVEARLKTIIEA